MVNKSAKALIFFAIALIAFLCSSVIAVQTYNMLADAEMEKAYANSDNITVEDAQDQSEDSRSSNNHYYPNNSTLSNSSNDNNKYDTSIFNINIFNLFNSTNGSRDFDLHTFFGELEDRIHNLF